MKPACASIRRARPLLGTFVEIAVTGACRPAMEEAVEAAFGAVAEVHRLMGCQDSNSDVARVNREAPTRALRVHPWTFEVLKAALDLQSRSVGIFDIAVKNPMEPCRSPPFQLRGSLPPPCPRGREGVGAVSGLRSVPEMPGNPSVELLPGRGVRFSGPDITIDLGGIAKGFAVDRAIAVLRDHDVEQALVNAGGDLAAFGPDAAVVSLRDPRDPRRVMGDVEIGGEALASSGRQVDPFRRSETTDTAVIDPRTLRPARAAVGATVRAGQCMIADALTKVVMIVGEAAASVLAEFGASALFVSPGGDLRISGNWQNTVRLAA
jgi:FAD:protein FMN transferase